MKAKIKILLFVAIASICFGCEDDATTPPAEFDCGLERIVGVVTNEKGEAIEGIRVEAYYDELLKEHYPSDAWYNMSDEDKIRLADREPVGYTDNEGYYYLAEVARYGLSTLDVYVVATDTLGLYKPQTQKGQIMYEEIIGINENDKLVAGIAIVDFVLQKND